MTKRELITAMETYGDNDEIVIAVYIASINDDDVMEYHDTAYHAIERVDHGFKPSNVCTLCPGNMISG